MPAPRLARPPNPRRLATVIAALGWSALPVTPPFASEACSSDAMIVFDGSGSMSETGFNQLGAPRISDARRAVRQAMPRVAPFRRLGLIIYGPGARDSCANIDLRFAPVPDAAARIIAEVEALAPAGETALTAAVARAAEVLDYTSRPGVIVLVTDGKETCGGMPCDLAASLAADAMELTVHVIGFKVRGEFFNWEGQGSVEYRQVVSAARCLADSTGGTYSAAESVGDLVAALQETLGCVVIGRQGSQAPGG